MTIHIPSAVLWFFAIAMVISAAVNVWHTIEVRRYMKRKGE